MKKPLVIIAQDKFFTQLQEELKAGVKLVEEEKLFCDRRIQNSVNVNVRTVWEKGVKELHKRGLIDDDKLGGEGEPGLHIDNGVVYMADQQGMANPIENLLGGILNRDR